MPLPTSFSLPYIAAQSKCRYPVWSATETASEALDLSRFHVPKPSEGMDVIETGLLRLKGICSCARDRPISAQAIEESFAIDVAISKSMQYASNELG